MFMYRQGQREIKERGIDKQNLSKLYYRDGWLRTRMAIIWNEKFQCICEREGE